MTTIAHLRAVHKHAPLQLNTALLEPLFVALTLIGIIVGYVLPMLDAPRSALLAVHAATYIFGGTFAIQAIIEALRRRQIEVDLLMVLAALGAAYVDAWQEGAILLFLFSLSNLLQHYAMRRTHQAIASLMELRPDTVTIRRNGAVEMIALDAVRPGDVLVLRPGDRVAVDAEIVRGSGPFDESAITGESMPVVKSAGALIYAGTVNQSSAIDAVVTRPASESTLARIIALVSEAHERKARTQSALERFEQYYAIAIILAVGLFILLVPWLFGVPFGDNFYRAMTLLTVASPCALVISVPAALLSAIANAARRGVLFKGGGHLEDLSQVKVVAFDKTGTITFGRPEITDVLPQPGVTVDELLTVAARAEQPSEHPIASAVRAYAQRQGSNVREPDRFEAVAGMGVLAVWDGVRTLVGSPRLMTHMGLEIPVPLLEEVDRLALEGRGTVLLVYRSDHWLGIVTVMDRERPGVAAKIAALRKAGVERVVMLTGDNRRVAEALVRRVGIDDVYAELLPEDKLRLIGELQRRYGPTAMVGDGINDAPALAAAHSGIAMGAAGTDVALETADVVLMSDDLGAIAEAIRLSKQTQRIVWQNIILSLSVIVVLVIATLTVGILLPIGVVGHEGSTLVVVANGLRLLVWRGTRDKMTR
jgi:Cd2+/Zn2+-exporting ATPase